MVENNFKLTGLQKDFFGFKSHFGNVIQNFEIVVKLRNLHALEKEMATLSSILAWRIPGKEEPSGLLSMGSHRVGHD